MNFFVLVVILAAVSMDVVRGGLRAVLMKVGRFLIFQYD